MKDRPKQSRVLTTRRPQRRWRVAIATVALVAAAAATALAVLLAAQLPWSLAERLALVGDLLTASTVLLAVLAGLIALAAYAAGTASPDLDVEVRFRFSFSNEPVLQLEAPDESGSAAIAPYRQCEAEVLVHNRASHSARNAAVLIRLIGMGGISGSPGWASLDFVNTVGATAVQWEGGADYAIHGNWTRVLPLLDFSGVRAYVSAQAALWIEVVADGFRSETRMPVQLLDANAYSEYSRARASRLKAVDAR